MNKLITFEGIEGSGKSTQMELIARYLTERNVPLLITREPSGTDIGRKIGDILFNRGHHHMCAETEAFLFCAARAQHVREKIMPAINQNKVVLCDRFSDATYAYQGAARGLSIEFIKLINDYSSMGIKPDLTLLFDLPAEAGLKRATDRDNLLKDASTTDRFEKESLDFHNKVRKGYLDILKNEPARFRLIDATRDIDAIHQEALRHILEFIELCD
ncbi:MAG: dTMP kinase [Smithella sp.]|nr:dTMP kinase [Syntrophaceae bacterium]NTW77303.1 dTMP kinase [Syntrophaceae bacterium]